jgi:Zn-dependent M28 family amino/carboxypeptidase
MVKTFFYLFLGIFSISCSSQNIDSSESKTLMELDVSSITIEDLKKHVSILASDSLEGRYTGEIGYKKAIDYVKKEYQKLNIPSPISSENYFQKVPKEFINPQTNDSENVLAYIKGSDSLGKHLIITAHLDHIGTANGKVYNGADDNASGTAALLEIAQAIKELENKGVQPKYGILFLHVTAEELGLFGSKYYTKNPIFPLKNALFNVNLDMIGRKDERNIGSSYLYSIGSDRISKYLHRVVLDVDKKDENLKLDFYYDVEDEPLQLYYRSDHYNFAINNIPSVFFFSGLHEDYHQPTDDVEKLEFDAYEKRVRFIAKVIWNLAN